MEVFFADKNKISKNAVLPFLKEEFNSLKRREEYALSRYLLDFALKNFYNIKSYSIEVKNKKPFLKDENLYFSISHSKDIALIAFDESETGVDVELMKNRDFSKFSKRFSKKFENKKDFYKFWTELESKIKLQKKACFFKNFEIYDYFVSVASKNRIENLTVYEMEKDECLKKLPPLS